MRMNHFHSGIAAGRAVHRLIDDAHRSTAQLAHNLKIGHPLGRRLFAFGRFAGRLSFHRSATAGLSSSVARSQLQRRRPARIRRSDNLHCKDRIATFNPVAVGQRNIAHPIAVHSRSVRAFQIDQPALGRIGFNAKMIPRKIRILDHLPLGIRRAGPRQACDANQT